jgi:hypothetical protein
VPDRGKVKRAKHGIDLGPLEPRLSGALDTADKRVQLAPTLPVEEAANLAAHAREREDARSDGYDRSSAAASCAATTHGCTTAGGL